MSENKKTLVSRIHEKAEMVDRPFSMMLELTNACNHRCLFCSHRKMKRSIKMMELPFAKRMVDEAYDMGVRELALFMMGESFLYQDIDEIILYAKQKGYEYVYITSNGALAEPERMKKAIDAGVDSIKFSINAVEREAYKLIHGRDELEAVLKNLEWLYGYKEKHQIPINIYVSSVATRYNSNENAIREKLEPLCDELAIYHDMNHEGLMPEVDLFLSDSAVECDVDARKKAPCPMVFNRLHVTVEGYLTACCMDTNNYLAYADLHKSDLKSAWNNKIVKELRNKHLCNDLKGSLCFNCINGTKENTKPLVDQLASVISDEEIADCKEALTRIEAYDKDNRI